MKQRHQILNDPRFRLVYDEHRPFTEAPAPRHLRLNCEGFTLAPGVKKKTQVYPGMLLATHPSMEKGDLHSSVYGVISDINVRSIFIDSADPADLDGSVRDAVVEPFDLLASGLEGDALIEAVKKLGVNTKSIGKKCDVLVINGLNPEPGVAWAEPMLDGHCPEIGAAIKLLRRIGRAGRLILAVPEGTVIDSREFDGIEIAYVEPEYPNSIGELLIKRITGIELPEGWDYVGIHNVWSLGRVALRGLPLMRTVITIGRGAQHENFIVRNGTIVGDLLEDAGIEVENGDTIFRGGPLRGEGLDRLDRSITKGAIGFFLLKAGEVPPMDGDSPCVNCGACVHICPTRIDPRMLSRYAEFARFDMSRKAYFGLCVDCGLCGYVCIARRPVLQYIRLAIAKLEQEDAIKRLVPIEPIGRN